MASLKDMRNRILSVKATQKITKAMQMVAAADRGLAGGFTSSIVRAARDHIAGLLEAIRTKKALDDKMEGELKGALETFSSTFA